MSWFWGSGSIDQELPELLEKLKSPTIDENTAQVALESIRSQVSKYGSAGKHSSANASASGSTSVEDLVIVLLSLLRNGPTTKNIIRLVTETLDLGVRPPATETNLAAVGGTQYMHILHSKALLSIIDPVFGTYGLNLLLEFLSLDDYYVRLNTVRIILSLIRNGQLVAVQKVILAAPTAIGTLMNLLGDHREAVRNESLLVFIQLTQSNVELQKIIAFENGFEYAFQIISREREGLVISDCLALVKNLLKANISNQNSFREMSYIAHLPSLLEITTSELWLVTDLQERIYCLSLDIISALIPGTNSNIDLNQEALRKHQIPTCVCKLALCKINSAVVRFSALNTLSFLLRDNAKNRSEFSALKINTGEMEEPALHRLLIISLLSQHFSERKAALGAFQSYLLNNHDEQTAIATTLLPAPEDSTLKEGSIGRRILLGLFDTSDPIRPWIASSMLSAIVADNHDCKQLVLRIPILIQMGDLPQTNQSSSKDKNLLSLCVELLQQQLTTSQSPSSVPAKQNLSHLLIQVGLIKLLCVWLFECPEAVSAFLANPKNLPFLVSVLNQPEIDNYVLGLGTFLLGICIVFNNAQDGPNSRSSVYDIFVHRVGSEKFAENLAKFKKTESFVSASQEREPRFLKTDDDDSSGRESFNTIAHIINESLFDSEFVSLFKNSCDSIIDEIKNPRKSKKSSSKSDELLAQKDREIAEMKRQLDGLRLSSAVGSNGVPDASVLSASEVLILQEQNSILEQQVETLGEAFTALEIQYRSKESEILKLRQQQQQQQQQGSNSGIPAVFSPPKLTAPDPSLLAELHRLKKGLQERDAALSHEKSRNDLLDAAVQSLQTELQDCRNEKESLCKQLALRPMGSSDPDSASSSRVVELENQLRAMETELEESREKSLSLEKELEEVFILIANLEIEKAQVSQRVALLESELEAATSYRA